MWFTYHYMEFQILWLSNKTILVMMVQVKVVHFSL